MLAMPQEWMTTTSMPSLMYIKQNSSNCTMQLADVWHRSTENSLATAELVRMKYQTVSVVTESLKVTCHFSLVRMVTEPTLLRTDEQNARCGCQRPEIRTRKIGVGNWITVRANQSPANSSLAPLKQCRVMTTQTAMSTYSQI